MTQKNHPDRYKKLPVKPCPILTNWLNKLAEAKVDEAMDPTIETDEFAQKYASKGAEKHSIIASLTALTAKEDHHDT